MNHTWRSLLSRFARIVTRPRTPAQALRTILAIIFGVLLLHWFLNPLFSIDVNVHPSVVPPGGPVNIVAPTIAAPPAFDPGSIMTVSSPGTWTDGPATSFTYQWQDCDIAGVNCANATTGTVLDNGVTYVLGSGDAGKTMRVVVTARSDNGSTAASSARTARVYSYLRGINENDFMYSAGYGGSNPGPYVVPAATFTYLAGRGIKLVRLNTYWATGGNTLQSRAPGPLNSTGVSRLEQTISNAYSAGIVIEIDIHSSCQYPSDGQGQPMATTTQMASLWSQLSAALKGNMGVWGYGLCNEPRGTDSSTIQNALYPDEQAAIDAIRANGDPTRINVSTGGYDDPSYWARYPHTFRDPYHNIEYEAHAYPAPVGDQTTYDAGAAQTSLAEITQFANSSLCASYRCYLGEFGWPGSNSSSSWSKFNDWGTSMYTVLDQHHMDATDYSAGGGWRENLMAYNGAGTIDPSTGEISAVTTAQTQSQVIEAHPSAY